MKNILINYGKKLIDNDLITSDFFQYDELMVRFIMDHLDLSKALEQKLHRYYYDNENNILEELELYYFEVKNAA